MPITAIIRKENKVSLAEVEGFQARLKEKSEIFILGDNLPQNVRKIVSLGGDGTVIECSRLYPNIPILGVNYGHLGFLSGIEKDEDPNQEFYLSERGTLKNSLTDELALNEIVIARGNKPRSLKLAVYINGMLLTKYLADGVIIASSTGSTAYSYSAGGSIVSPELEALIITPICPHFRRPNSFVFPKSTKIGIEIFNAGEANLTIDGQSLVPIEEKQIIEISYSESKVKLLYKEDYSFIERLNGRYRR